MVRATMAACCAALVQFSARSPLPIARRCQLATSPHANTPGALVRPQASVAIPPSGARWRWPATSRVAGTARVFATPEAAIEARVAVTGKAVGPGLYDCLALLGRETSLARIQLTLDELASGE